MGKLIELYNHLMELIGLEFYNKDETNELLEDKVNTTDSRLSDSRTPTSHKHGDLSNDGKIGTTANKPIITTTSGKLTTGSFGTAANTFCQGNDSRLSDSRTPTSHKHGDLSNDGKIGTAANKPIITTTNGVLTTGSFGTAANTFCQGNDSRLSDSRTPNSHASTSTTYGVGSTTNYGHCKTINNLTTSSYSDGNALSAYQGKLLKDAVDKKLGTVTYTGGVLTIS